MLRGGGGEGEGEGPWHQKAVEGHIVEKFNLIHANHNCLHHGNSAIDNKFILQNRKFIFQTTL